MEIDTILKSNKASRPKKRKKEDDLDQFADAEVSQLREEMLNAAELDEQANREKLPATLKLKLLPKVMGALRKSVFCLQISTMMLIQHAFTGTLFGSLLSTITFWRVCGAGWSHCQTSRYQP
jgi:transcription factor SPN1